MATATTAAAAASMATPLTTQSTTHDQINLPSEDPQEDKGKEDGGPLATEGIVGTWQRTWINTGLVNFEDQQPTCRTTSTLACMGVHRIFHEPLQFQWQDARSPTYYARVPTV
ncbi:hypothetical protein AB5N19_10921 [Seiridium cardinale]